MNEKKCQLPSHSRLISDPSNDINLTNNKCNKGNNDIQSIAKATDESVVDIKEVIKLNKKLCEHLHEVTAERDSLVCELAKLRLEFDMTELKRIPVESFPQKTVDLGTANQYAVTLNAANPDPSAVAGCVYYSSHLSRGSSGSGSVVNNSQNQSNMLFDFPIASNQTHAMHYPFVNRPQCPYTKQQMQTVPGQHYCNSSTSSKSEANVAAVNLYGIEDMQTPSSLSMMPQHLLKKNSIRSSSEIIKRSRTQLAYELSQDLLEKQIELLERKYGGIRARNAAIVIQRAFRHYTMVKKFASITAMAKAEKRHSRRALSTSTDETFSKDCTPSTYESTHANTDLLNQEQHAPRVTILAQSASNSNSNNPCLQTRNPPARSISMREKRQIDGPNILVRNQQCITAVTPNASECFSASGASSSAHPHVNLLHASEASYYATHNLSNLKPAALYSKSFSGSHEVSFASSSNSSNLDTSLNSSWLGNSTSSPHTPYYSAAQIYMRPKGTSQTDRKKVPPEVPKRTSSITAQQNQQMILMRHTHPSNSLRYNSLCKTSENGSLTSVQSSGSDSSVTSMDKPGINDVLLERSNSSQTWKRVTTYNSHKFNNAEQSYDPGMSSNLPSNADDQGTTSSSHTSAAQYEQQDPLSAAITQNYKVSETIRKRQYRVGLNLFNKKPEKGVSYLIRRGFLENTPQGVARFLITRKGLSRQMIGEYLGNLQNQFNMAVLNCFALELDLSGMQVDVALRKFQAYFRMPGEAQKIERLMEVFSQRYCQCNQDIVGRLRSADTVFVLSFAIIMLNTDLHTPNLKPERRMRVEDFIKNLRGIDDCHDIDKDMLSGIYERVKANEFKPGSDHVTQVMKVQATIVGKKPNLALPHRRLVCYCRLYEIPDLNKKERPGVHQREVFLFNDMLVITKIFSKKKCSVTYTFRNSFSLCGMVVSLLDVPNYAFCIQLSQKVDGKILITFNARNEHDRCKFAEDLKESISEMDEMEALRIEAELERQKSARNRVAGNSENRDSGVADVEVCACPFQSKQVGGVEQELKAEPSTQQIKRSALSNSLLDIHDQLGNEKPQRRGSVGSLDSGMSISFQSAATSGVSRETANNSKSRFSLSTTATTISGVYPSPSTGGGLHHQNIFPPTQTFILPIQSERSNQFYNQVNQHNLKIIDAPPPLLRNQNREFSPVESGQSTDV